MIHRPHGDDQQGLSASYTRPAPQASPDSPAVVFVVDDEPLVRDAIACLVRSVGLDVRTFGSAAEFQEHRRADAPSCLILDVRLPGVSGLDLQRALSSAGETLPIIS